MPTLGLLGGAVLVSAAAAAVVFALATLPWRKLRPWQRSAGSLLGICAGIYAGCAFLGQWPRWPPTEDRHRYLTILLPLALLVELAALFVPARWQAWLLRLCVACAAAPILLYNSIYFTALSGPGSAEWSPAYAAIILDGLAALLLGTWVASCRLQARTSERTVSTALSLTCLAAAFTVMLSGYYRGGLLGLPIGGALLGLLLSATLTHRQRIATEDDPNKDVCSGVLGIGLVGLFTLLLIGRFFGSLPASFALVLFLSPLLAWLVELPGLRKLPPNVRTVLRVFVVAVPLIVVLVTAQVRFIEAWKAKSRPAIKSGSAVYFRSLHVSLESGLAENESRPLLPSGEVRARCWVRRFAAGEPITAISARLASERRMGRESVFGPRVFKW